MSWDTEVLSPAPRAAWSAVLAEDPGATVYQTLAWFDAVRALTGAQDASRLYVTGDGRRLVLPLLRRTPLPGVTLQEGYPGRLGSGGILATGGLRTEDVTRVLTDLVGSPALFTRIKANHDTSACWQEAHVPGASTSLFRVEVLDLDGGFSRVWSDRFHHTARKNVAKAERSGLTVEQDGGSRLVPALCDIYLAWTAERAAQTGLPRAVAAALAKRREPRRMFEVLAGALPGSCRTWVASYRGEPVAALMTFVHGEHAISFRGYGRREFASLRANNLLQRLAIEDACQAGCRYYSLGESSGVAGLQQFKRSLGATPRSAVECRIERLPVTRLEELRGRAESTAARVLRAARRRGGGG